MTINVGLVTSDALVLGCDSVASTTGYYINPLKMKWDKDANGKPVADSNGKFGLKFDFSDFEQVVTDAWGGVTKMFEIHPMPSPMVAVISGLAKLSDRPIADLGGEFFSIQKERQQKLIDPEKICAAFRKFMRKKYDEHYRGSSVPASLRDGPEFLVGGYGKNDAFPCLYRIKVKENTVQKDFGTGTSKSGISWNGQSDAVERFIRGYDSQVQSDLEAKIVQALDSHSQATKQYVATLINEILTLFQRQLPQTMQINVPDPKPVKIDWKKYSVDVNFASLPIQDAVHFVSFLVMMQIGKARFARGVPTVGGRNHVGVVTKAKGFEPLGEPKLAHRLTGFGDDL